MAESDPSVSEHGYPPLWVPLRCPPDGGFHRGAGCAPTPLTGPFREVLHCFRRWAGISTTYFLIIERCPDRASSITTSMQRTHPSSQELNKRVASRFNPSPTSHPQQPTKVATCSPSRLLPIQSKHCQNLAPNNVTPLPHCRSAKFACW